jgi:hypothetical protein
MERIKVNAKKATICLVLGFLSHYAHTQSVGIGTNTPNANAKLEIADTGKGILIPRMDSTHRKNIPATVGLMVYDSSTLCFWYNNGTSWVNMPGAGTTKGDMLYWNGSRWVILPAGSPGQYLTVASGTLLPVWSATASVNITTASVSAITQTGAVSGGTITTDGGAAITARGVVWSTTTNPTIALTTKTADGTGTGTFSSTLTGLAPATTYYVRSYATNSNGTSYGNQINFTTSAAAFTPGQTFGGVLYFMLMEPGSMALLLPP